MNPRIQQEVYRIVRRIPRGRVLSYGAIAEILGIGARQVGAAIRNCPAGLPWHRVVGAGGRILTPGETGQMQRQLLIAEGIHVGRSGFAYERYQYNIKLSASGKPG